MTGGREQLPGAGGAAPWRVAVLGTGLMGAGIARSLLRAGHRVTVWNRSPGRAAPLAELGAAVAGSPAEAVGEADVVLVTVFDAASVLAVLEAAGRAAPPDAVWVQLATIGPEGTAAVAAGAAARGITLVEAMMMGSKEQAEAARLILLGGGDASVFARIAPVLAAVSQRVVHAGAEVGHGTALKMACNAWIATITAGTAQSIALLRGQGLDPRLFLQTITGGTSDSPYAHLKGGKIIAGDYDPQFAVAAIRKDLHLIRGTARGHGIGTGLLDVLLALYDDAAAGPGGGEADIAAVYESFTR